MLFVGPRMRVCFAFRDACGAQELSPESGLGLGASVLHSGTPAVLKVNVRKAVCILDDMSGRLLEGQLLEGQMLFLGSAMRMDGKRSTNS